MMRALLCLGFVILVGTHPGLAQTELTDAQFDRLTQRWNQTLDNVSDDLRALTITGDTLSALRDNIRIVEDAALEARAAAAVAAAEDQALIDAMGPAPAEGEVPEDEALAAERALIADRLSSNLGRLKRSSVVLARARELLDRTVEEETEALMAAVGKRTVSPLMPSVVASAASQLGQRIAELHKMMERAWQQSDLVRPSSPAGGALLALVAIALLVAVPLRRWLLSRYGPDPTIDQPSATRRLQAITAAIVANAVLPALVIAGFQLVVAQSPVVASELRLALDVVLVVAVDVVPLVGLVFAILAPGHPHWRIGQFADDAARNVCHAIGTYAVLLLVLVPGLLAISPVYLQGRFLEIIGVREELSAVGGLLGVLLLGIAMLNLMRPRNWRYRSSDEVGSEAGHQRGHAIARTVMVLVALGVLASMILSIVGYVNFGIFVSRSMTRTLVVVGYALCLRSLLHEVLRVATNPENAVGRWLRDRLLLDDEGATRLVFWLTLVVDVAFGILLVGMVLVVWGLPGAVIQQGIDLGVEGFDVGGFNLSVVNIGLALGVLVALLTGVRVFQHFLADRVLVQTRLELGVRDALTTGVSYVGYVLAALITFSVLGLDVGNIALIFGALSVGIGFGLQHVVSNFVSGLILLIQRPIKAGDWIVVGDQQGYVRRISVISTEIQTFDAAAVIIPNSTMLSSQVINWHLHNKLGRVIVAVGTSYDSDPEQVRDVLLACAADHPDTLRRPAPQVVFMNFGDSSLDFELRFFLREIDQLLRVSSEIRFAIKKAFREAGIEIPYPQRDVHLRGPAPSSQPDSRGSAAEDSRPGACSPAGS